MISKTISGLLLKPSKAVQVTAVISFFALIAGIALYLPIFNLTTHITGKIVTDYFHFYWNYWWIRHALTTPGLNVYEMSYIFSPYTSSLAYHTLTPVWYPIWALIEPIAGRIPAMTAIFATAYTLTGLTMYALLRQERVSRGLSLVGGSMLALCSIMFNSTYWTMVNLMSWFWLPLLMLIWKQIIRATNTHNHTLLLRWTVVLGFTFWAMILTDLQYPLFAFCLIGPYGLLSLWRACDWTARLSLVGAAVAAVLIGIVLLTLWGPLIPLLQFDRSTLVSTPAERAVEIPFPDGFISRLPIPQAVSLGVLILPLLILTLLLSLLNRRQQFKSDTSRWFWLSIAIPPLILSAGASITFESKSIILPYVQIHNLLGGQFRYPERFSPAFLVGATLFIGITLTSFLRFRNRCWRFVIPGILLLAVAADTGLFRSTEIQPQPVDYAFYHEMGEESEDYVVLEVPTGGSSGESIVGEQRFAALMWYGQIHGKRMVNGHISRVDPLHFWWMRTDDAMMAWLGQRRFIDPEVVAAQLRQRVKGWPIGYIVIHQDMIGRDGPTVQEIIGWLNSQDDVICPVWVEKEAVVYRARWHPAGCPSRTPPQDPNGDYFLNIGSEGDERYIGWGWHWPEDVAGLTLRWTGEYQQTLVYVDLPPSDYELSLSIQAFWEPRHIRVLANGSPLSNEVTVNTDSLQTINFQLPQNLFTKGEQMTITIEYDRVIIPNEVGQSADPRKLAVAIDWLRFRPN